MWKDPIWDTYTQEEILIEYYAYLYELDEKVKHEFEVGLDAGAEVYGEAIYDWLDRMVEENQEVVKRQLAEMPDKVSFSPNKDTEE